MAELRETLERLLNREHLAESEAAALLLALTDPSMPPAMAGALLAHCAARA
jgi:anthranilate phosphoribosyltransferase